MTESEDRRQRLRLVEGGGERPAPDPESEREHVHVLVVTARGVVTATVMEALAADKIWDQIGMPQPVCFDLAEHEVPVEALDRNYVANVLEYLRSVARDDDEQGWPATTRELRRALGPGVFALTWSTTLQEVLERFETEGSIERVVRADGEDAWVYVGEIR